MFDKYTKLETHPLNTEGVRFAQALSGRVHN